MTRPNRLFKEYEVYYLNSAKDYLYLWAVKVENTFLEAGATPDVDYTYKDIMELAVKLYIEEASRVGGF